MIERTLGFVMRVLPLTETSLIVRWLTRDHGRISTVAKGARRPQSPFRGKLDLFYQVDLTFSRSRRSDLHTLREASLRDTFELLRRELPCLRQAAYAAHLIEQVTETETPVTGMYDLLDGFLHALPARPPGPLLPLALELKLLAELGQAPDLLQTSLRPATRQVAANLAGLDWPALARLQIPITPLSELTQFLHGFILYHLGKMPSGRAEALL